MGSAAAPLFGYSRALAAAPPLTPRQELQVALLLDDLRRELVMIVLSLPEGPAEVAQLIGGSRLGSRRRETARRPKDPDERARQLLALAERGGLDAGLQTRVIETFCREPRFFRRQPGRFISFHRLVRLRERLVGQIILANARLVVNVAQKFHVPGLDTDDLIQEGNLGLIRALESFDYRRGFRFSTYAGFWIKQAILDGISRKARMVRLPQGLVRQQWAVERFRKDFSRRRGRLPGEGETARALGLTLGRLLHMPPARERVSLEKLTEGHGPSTPEELVRLAPEALENLLQWLCPKERRVLEGRFGLSGAGRKTLSELGRSLSLSRERVRQIERKALARLSRRKYREKIEALLGLKFESGPF